MVDQGRRSGDGETVEERSRKRRNCPRREQNKEQKKNELLSLRLFRAPIGFSCFASCGCVVLFRILKDKGNPEQHKQSQGEGQERAERQPTPSSGRSFDSVHNPPVSTDCQQLVEFLVSAYPQFDRWIGAPPVGKEREERRTTKEETGLSSVEEKGSSHDNCGEKKRGGRTEGGTGQ